LIKKTTLLSLSHERFFKLLFISSIMGKKSVNSELARIFFEMADIFELKEVKWKPQAYRIAAQTLESLRKDVSEIYKEKGQEGLEKLPGIGEGIAKKIIQYIKTRRIKQYEELKKSIPSGLYKIMNIPGIGPKRASIFYNKLGIKNINQLKKAAEKGRIKNLPLFKEKAEKNILEGIKLLKEKKGRIPLEEAKKIAKTILRELKKIREIQRVEIAGSYRRKKPTIGDFDIIIQTDKPKIVADKFSKLSFVKKVLAKGEDKITAIIKQGFQVDLRFFTKENFGSGLLYFTGDKQHNIWLRKKAIKKGYKLNEYGLFDEKGKRIAGKTEAEIYKKLGVKMLPPEKRIGETLSSK